MTVNDADRPQQDPPVDHLEVVVDGRHVEARLTRFPASERGPRQPRWMLRIDDEATLRGPLTWDTALDPDVERAAIVTFVRDRRHLAKRYVAEHGELLQQMSDLGMLGAIANALGVAPGDLIAQQPREQG